VLFYAPLIASFSAVLIFVVIAVVHVGTAHRLKFAQSVDPSEGQIFGGASITVYGQNLGGNNPLQMPVVYVDGVPCLSTQVTPTLPWLLMSVTQTCIFNRF
jgi:hypothetical protein